MAVNPSALGPKPQLELADGTPAVGNQLFFYVAGSVNTKQNTYTDSTGGSANANPIVLNALGQPTTQIWFTAGQSYKVVYAPSTDTDPPTSPIWTIDNLIGINDSTNAASEWVAGPAPTFISATSFSLVGDQTATFTKGRRVKTTNTGGTVYSTITNSAFGAATTVTVANDSGTLDAGLSAVSYGLISSVNPAIDADMIYRKGTAVASAATTDIWGIVGDYVHISGNTGPITSFGTAPYAGDLRKIIFDSTPTITNSSSLRCPGDQDITAAANDVAVVIADTTTTFRIVHYQRAFSRPAQFGQMFIAGLTIANNAGDATNDIDIAAGSCRDASNAMDMILAATLTKQSDVAWAVGSGNGGLDTGAVGNNDYYIWLIKRSDTGVVDALYSLSSTAPTTPANYDFKRLIGWIKRVGGTIVAFDTYETEGGGIEMKWRAPTLDIAVANTLTTARRTDAVKVPLNFSTIAHLRVNCNDGASNFSVRICCPDETDAAVTASTAPLANYHAQTGVDEYRDIVVRTSSTGTVAARSDLATVDTYNAATVGFKWARRN